MSINSNSTNIQLDTKRHSFAHLMAAAVGQMFPEAQYGVGPVIENGCYYDFVLPRNLIPEDLPLLENNIKDLLKRDLRFKVQELSLEDAIAHFSNAKQLLKVELLENLRDRGTTSMSEEEKADFGDQTTPVITIYRIVDEKTGEVVFEDLCKGPHVPGVRKINNQNNERTEANTNEKAVGNNSPLEGWQPKVDGVDLKHNIPLPNWKTTSLFPFWDLPKNKELETNAKELRQAGVLSETIFWQNINNKEILRYDIDRQAIIGNYIVDFFIPELGLVFEIDGESHDYKGGYDKTREAFLQSLNLQVIHFADIEIKKAMDQVGESVMGAIKMREKVLIDNPAWTPPRQPAVAIPQAGNYNIAEGQEVNVSCVRLELQQTIDTYNTKLDQYIAKTNPVIDGILKEWIDLMLSKNNNQSSILEIGSGTGKDADYIESNGSK